MRFAIIAVLLAGCGSGGGGGSMPDPPDLTPEYRAGNPAELRPQREGEFVIPDVLKLRSLKISPDGSATSLRAELENISGKEVRGYVRARYWDSAGKERRTARSMEWREITSSPGKTITLDDRYPAKDISGAAIEFSEAKK